MATYYNPPHRATDEAKIAAMMETIRRGCPLPPIVVYGDWAICGSHRIEAYGRAYKLAESLADGWESAADTQTPAIELEQGEYLAALSHCDMEPGDEDGDWNAFCAAVYDVTADPNIKAALADQR